MILALFVSNAWSACPAFGDDKPESSVRFVLEWGELGSEQGRFNFPIGIVIDRSNQVVVTDFYNARVQRFSSEGRFLSSFAVSAFPGGIAIDREGNLFVAHMGIPPSRFDEPRKRDKIAVFSPAGELLREWGEFGTGDGQFDMPGGLAIGRDDRVYVADQCNRRIQAFDARGKFLTKWGQKGFQTGEFGGNPHPKAFFAGPTFVACDKDGNVYTTESVLGRIQKFSAEGTFLATWGDNEVAPGKFGGFFTGFGQGRMVGPTGLVFDSHGRLWINSIGGRIQRFTDQGTYQIGFGEEGAKPGEFYAPHGVAVDSRGFLYVVDAFNHRIQKFEIVR